MAQAKKKILYVVEAMGGGVFTYVVDLANQLVNDYDMTIAYALRPQTPENFREYFDPRVQLIRVENFCREISPARDMNAVRELRRIAEKVDPDIIHLHSSKAGVIGRIAFSGKKVPLFYTPHGYSFLMADVNAKKRFVFRFIEWAMAKRRCTTISCSRGEHEETLRLTRRAVYVDNAVNTDKLTSALSDVRQKEHPFTVFTLGRICTQKNPALFNQIAERMPDVRFLWIGDGELRNELTAPNIEVTGWVDRATALSLSVNTDAFLLTSLWEGLPMSLLEAMFLRKPCIVSNVIGNRDVIHSGENGFVCDQLSDYVSTIGQVQTGCPEHLIQHAFDDISTHYDTKHQSIQYQQIYEGQIIPSR